MKFDVAAAAEFVKRQIESGRLSADDIARLVAFYQEHHGLAVDGKPGPATLAELDELDEVTVPAGVYLPPGLIDMRARTSRSKVYGRRPWSKVTGVCLHQTACLMGERPERYENTGAHVVITRGGKIIWLHDFDELVVHGNGWNAGCVGIEIDGLYAGIEGDPRTVWDNPDTPSRELGMTMPPVQAEASRAAVRWIDREVKAKGGKLKVVVAHRQASDTRRNDPGSAIWQQVAMPLHAELHLTDGGPGFKIGDGYPIPEAWDPSRTGIKY